MPTPGIPSRDLTARHFCKDLSLSPQWVDAVENNWPAPVAHEYHRLREVLADGQIVSAVLQLKDVVEILIKFPVLIMARWLDAHGDDLQREALNRQMLGKVMSLGDWLALAHHLAQILNVQAPPELMVLARAYRTQGGKVTSLYKFLTNMISWRNSEIGHGAFRLDVSEFQDDLKQNIETLHKELNDIAHLWDHCHLMQADGSQLRGWQSIRTWHDGSATDRHREALAPLYLHFGAEQLDLSPLIALRQCTLCGKQDVFLFDARDGRRKPGKLFFLDYMAGHKMARPGHVEPRLDADIEQAASDHDLSADYIDSQVDDLLQSKSLEAEYLPVDYLRQPLRQFLETASSGVWWLQAPAHIGKSLFVHALNPDVRLEQPLLDDLLVATFHIRREYRYHPAQLKETLAEQFKQRMGLNNLAKELPGLDLAAAEPGAAFADWLGAWWAIRPPRYRVPGSRLLVCIDGLDEIAAPQAGQRSLADYLPAPQRLPDGVYVLLTSRPQDGCPHWVWQAASQRFSTADGCVGTLPIGLDHPDYRALLRRHFNQRLNTRLKGTDSDARDALFDTLLQRSEGRFLYIGLLCGLLADSAIDLDQVATLPSGAGLYDYYLDTLEHRLAAKPRSGLQRLLLLLAAAEEAAVADYRLQAETMQKDGQAGAAQSTGGYAWDGMPMPVLASLMGDKPGHLGSQTVFALYSLKDVLRVERSEAGAARYRLGLKELAATLRKRWPEALNNVHREMAEGFWQEWQGRWAQLQSTSAEDVWRLSYLWGHGLILYGEPVAGKWPTGLLEDEALTSRLSNEAGHQYEAADYAACIGHNNRCIWGLQGVSREVAGSSQRQHDLAAAYMNRGTALGNLGDTAGAVADYSMAIGSMETLRADLTKAGQAWPPAWQNDLAAAYMNRGNPLHSLGDAAGAVADYSMAIGSMETLRADLTKAGQAWPPEWQNNLAAAYLNRGNPLDRLGDAAGAVADYSMAIGRMETLRADLAQAGQAWPPAWQNDLGKAYMNRGNALLSLGDAAGGEADYSMAIGRMETLRADLAQAGQAWQPAWQNDLAGAYMNRGNALLSLGATAGAVADYSMAIGRMETLRADLAKAGQAWPPEWQNEFATTYVNRGTALGNLGDTAGAVADYSMAIGRMETLRADLAKAGQAWPPEWQNEFATTYVNRGTALGNLGDTAGAVADYSMAIGRMETLRADLAKAGQAWPPEWQNNLAGAYVNRGNALLSQGDAAGGMADYSMAIGRMETLRADLAEVGQAWPPEWQNNLATAYVNRGIALDSQGDTAGAMADYSMAVGLRETLRADLVKAGQAWPPAWQNDLATAYMNRGDALRSQGDTAGAMADHSMAIGLRETLRADLAKAGQAWPPAWQNDLATTYVNRGNALLSQGDTAGGMVDYSMAIGLRETLRADLALAGQAWPPAWQNDLATTYVNRGIALLSQGDAAGAVANYSMAIGRMETLRADLVKAGQAWPPAWQNELAKAYRNRGIALDSQGDTAGAMADYSMAIGRMETLRADLVKAGQAWPPAWQNELAKAYMNRGIALLNQGDAAGAVADYSMAIGRMETLRADLVKAGQAWPPAWQNELAFAYVNRGYTLDGLGDAAGAWADYGEGIKIASALFDSGYRSALPMLTGLHWGRLRLAAQIPEQTSPWCDEATAYLATVQERYSLDDLPQPWRDDLLELHEFIRTQCAGCHD